jgi:hypothetical protein
MKPSKIASRWPALFIGFGLVLTLSWWVLLGWLLTGPLEAGVRHVIAGALSLAAPEAKASTERALRL